MDGRESTEIEHIGGKLRTVMVDVNISRVSVVVEEACYLSIQKLADDVHISRMSI